MFGRVSVLLFLLGLSLSGAAQAAYLATGYITHIYSSPGRIAIHLDTGFSDAQAECPTALSYYWAGTYSADAMMKAMLLMAKATGSLVTISIQGCEANGNWFKLNDVYVK